MQRNVYTDTFHKLIGIQTTLIKCIDFANHITHNFIKPFFLFSQQFSYLLEYIDNHKLSIQYYKVNITNF
jgi:hypothetical protein